MDPMNLGYDYAYPKRITNKFTPQTQVTLVDFNIHIIEPTYFTAVH